jgi:methyl-accepting chemotaxis protein
VLAPIAHITSVAREIQARELSRRIELDGPDDELKRLADTFDSMLARLDLAFAVAAALRRGRVARAANAARDHQGEPRPRTDRLPRRPTRAAPRPRR